MKFPVFSLLAGNLAFSETSSQLTLPSSGESRANLTSSAQNKQLPDPNSLFAASVSTRCARRDRPEAGRRPRYRKFESIPLQQTVCLSPANVFEGREPRLSARVSAAGLATGSAETRRVFQFAPVGGNISVGPYSSTALPLSGGRRGRPLIRTKSGLRRTERAVDL